MNENFYFPQDETLISTYDYPWLKIIEKLPELPPNLETLDLYETNIRFLPEFPPRLKILGISRTKIQSLPQLPVTLKELVCWESHIQHIPKLPEGFVRLYAKKCLNLKTIYNFPDSLESLTCFNCPNLKSFFIKIPRSLTQFFCDKSFLTRTLLHLEKLLDENIGCLDIEDQLQNTEFRDRCEDKKISLQNITKKILVCKENRKYMIETLYHTDPDSSALISYYDTGLQFKDREINFEFKRSRKKKSRLKSSK